LWGFINESILIGYFPCPQINDALFYHSCKKPSRWNLMVGKGFYLYRKYEQYQAF